MAEASFAKAAGPWRFTLNGRIYTSDEMDVNGKSWTDNAGRRRTYDQDLSRMWPGTLQDLDGDGLYEVLLDGKRVDFTGRIENATRDWFLQAGLGYEGFNLTAYTWRREEADDLWYTSQKRSRSRWIPTGSAIALSHDHAFSPSLANRAYLLMRTSGIDGDSRESSYRAYFTGNAGDPRELAIYDLGRYTYSKLFAREYRLGDQLSLSRGDTSAVFGGELTRSDTPENYATRTLTSQPWSTTPRHEGRNVAAFANAQTKAFSWLSLAGGLRYDHNTVAGEDGGFGNLFTLRGAAIATPSPRHTLKLIYGQSFQEPDPWHRFALDPGVRDLRAPDLKPEKLRSLEMDYDFNASSRWRSSASAYYTRVEELIRLVSVPYGPGTTNQFRNIGELEVRGLEFESRFFFTKDVSLFFNATATSAKDPKTGRKTGDIAPLKANTGLEASLGNGWDLCVRGHYVAPRDTVNFDSPSPYIVRKVDGHFTVDLSVGRRDIAKGLDLRISVYNLFDAAYYDPGPRSADGKSYNGAIVQQPFHAFVSLRYHY
jgi:outer membrane receptor protein involved in Fe transport